MVSQMVTSHDRKFGRLFVRRFINTIGAIALAYVVIPLFFYLISDTGYFLNHPELAGYKAFVRLGAALGGVIMVMLGMTIKQTKQFQTPAVVAVAAICLAGVVPVLFPGLLSILPFFGYLAGFLLGLGLDALVLVWSLRVGYLAINSLLVKCSLCCIVAVLANVIAAMLLPSITGIAFALMLAISFCTPLWASIWGELKFPHYDSQPLLGQGEGSPGKLARLIEMVFVLATSAFGLMIFAVLSNAQAFDFNGSGPTITAYGIVGSALIIASLVHIFRNSSILPPVYLLLFPALAGILIFLDSFHVETPVFTIGAGGAFFYFSAIAVFAISFLLAVSGKGEFPTLIVIGVSMSLLAFASLFGYFLIFSGLPQRDYIPLLLVICTCFFIYMLISPAIQVWYSRRGDTLAPRGQLAVSENYNDKVESIAKCHNLSRRESEVLFYVGRGYNASYTAKALYISESTARTHFNSIYHKLGVTTRAEILEMFEAPAPDQS
jgi:DNA-binding CsgD family transcriptional regulator